MGFARRPTIAAGVAIVAVCGWLPPAHAQWRDAATGSAVQSGVIVEPVSPGGNVYRAVVPEAGDPNRAIDVYSGRNFVRDAKGRWRDANTGKPVTSGPIVGSVQGGLTVAMPNPRDPNRAVDPATGRLFVRDGETRTAPYRLPAVQVTARPVQSLPSVQTIPPTNVMVQPGEAPPIIVIGWPGMSDIRAKRDIAPLARLDNGIGLYRFRYTWSDQLYVGVIAQEVASVMPDAVIRGADGYLRVDYGRLGLQLLTWDEWQAAH